MMEFKRMTYFIFDSKGILVCLKSGSAIKKAMIYKSITVKAILFANFLFCDFLVF